VYDPAQANDLDADLDDYPTEEPLDEFTSGRPPYPFRKCGTINRPKAEKLWYAVNEPEWCMGGMYLWLSVSSVLVNNVWLIAITCTR
jgi:hypothetical protein